MLDSFDTVRFTALLYKRSVLMGYATVLTNLGEKMSDEEVDELLKAVDTSSGEINYTGKSSFGS